MKLYEFIAKDNKVFLVPIKEIKLITYTPNDENVDDEILDIYLKDNQKITIKGNVLDSYYALRKAMGKLK